VSSTIIQGILTVAAGQQTSGVQVVEWVGLVGGNFQFFTRLAAVFEEEVDNFVVIAKCRHI
jgi:hypothetical protein